MKIRKGFVSNSSSSSFIIEIDKSEPCKHCGRKDIDILDIIRELHCDDYNTTIYAEGKKAVLEDIVDWIDNPEVINQVNKAKGNVVYLSISNGDSTTVNLLENSKNIKIIYVSN